MNTETRLMSEIQLRIGSQPNCRIFRNQVGVGWVGGPVRHLRDGKLMIMHPRAVHMGLCVGSGDLIGWKSREITQADVGSSIAQFMSIEVKTSHARSLVRPEQIRWLQLVRKMGGIAEIATSADEAERLLT